ncbi:MAG: shikimate dehydrogenase [Porphyromonadaceae bacterium CG2_30_38_12]|nr:MAG: shikimate dehydrogenase [Porphyromonadaceae bacterium CG2_30_38_12]
MQHYGLIGYPLGHSFSKMFFSQKFSNEKIDAVYEAYPLETIQEFEKLIRTVTLNGLNVTIPYKEQVIPFLNEINTEAAQIGAVNTIKFIRQNGVFHLVGYNTDAIGFENSIKPLFQKHHTKALILGTGGASKAIRYVLEKNGIETQFVSRSKSDLNLCYQDLNEALLTEYTVVVNASPVGTFPNEDACPAIPYQFLTERHLLFDVVYNPSETMFLKNGRAQGAIGINGALMLEKQALAAWEIWNT